MVRLDSVRQLRGPIARTAVFEKNLFKLLILNSQIDAD